MTKTTHAGKGGWVWSHSIVMAIVVLFFFPWWWGGKVLAPLDVLTEMLQPWRTSDQPQVHNHFVSDSVTQYLPYRWLAQESFRQDGYIGWNNLTAGGIDQSANTMALYFDWTMQLHRWFDFWTAWHLGLIGQFILAGCGMLVFLRSRGIGPWFALPAAVVFLMNFQFIACLYHRWALSAFCWVPWLLWALLAWRDGRRRFSLLVPVFLALGFLGGTLQHAAFLVVVVGCCGLAWMLQDRAQPRQLLRTAGIVLGFMGLGILLAAPMFLPCVGAYLDSVAGGQLRGGLGYPEGRFQPLLNLISYAGYLFPHPLGSPDTLDAWKLFKNNLFHVAYFGALPFLAAGLALGCRRFPLEARLLMLTGFLIPLTPLVGPLYHRVTLVGITGGVWLFAHALQFEREWLVNWLRRLWPWVLGAVLVWGLMSLAIYWQQAWLETKLLHGIAAKTASSTFGCLPDWIAHRAGRWIGSLLIWDWRNLVPLLALLGAIQLLLCRSTRPWCGPLLTLLLLAEVGTYASRWVGFSPKPTTGLYPETEETRVLRQLVGNGMVYIPSARLCEMPFPPNTLSAYGIRSWPWYESILPRGMAEHLGPNPTAQRLGVCGVTHLVQLPAQPVPEAWTELWRNDRIIIHANNHPWPRYCALAPGMTWSADTPRKMDAPVEVLAATQNRRTLRVPAGATAIRVAENWSANWEYTVDGQKWEKAQRGSDGSLLLPLPVAATPTEVQVRFRRQFRGWADYPTRGAL